MKGLSQPPKNENVKSVTQNVSFHAYCGAVKKLFPPTRNLRFVFNSPNSPLKKFHRRHCLFHTTDVPEFPYPLWIISSTLFKRSFLELIRTILPWWTSCNLLDLPQWRHGIYYPWRHTAQAMLYILKIIARIVQIVNCAYSCVWAEIEQRCNNSIHLHVGG